MFVKNIALICNARPGWLVQNSNMSRRPAALRNFDEDDGDEETSPTNVGTTNARQQVPVHNQPVIDAEFEFPATENSHVQAPRPQSPRVTVGAVSKPAVTTLVAGASSISTEGATVTTASAHPEVVVVSAGPPAAVAPALARPISDGAGPLTAISEPSVPPSTIPAVAPAIALAAAHPMVSSVVPSPFNFLPMEWFASQTSDWIDADSPRYTIVLSGPSACGKSSLLAQLQVRCSLMF